MQTTNRARHERLQVRLDAEAKGVLQRAASYRHKTLSQFVLSTALEEAERIIRENEVVTLSGPDWTILHDAMTNPPEPTAALRQAFERYRTANE